MDPADLIALLTVTGSGLTVIVVAARLYTRRLAFKERALEIKARTPSNAPEKNQVIERLEARVRVLERIATDKGATLAAKIEDLREERSLVE